MALLVDYAHNFVQQWTLSGDLIFLPNIGTKKDAIALKVSYISVLALFILAGCAAGGVLTVSTIGYSALVIGGVSLSLKLLATRRRERCHVLFYACIQALTAIICGALAITGYMSAMQVGYAIIGVRVGACLINGPSILIANWVFPAPFFHGVAGSAF